MRGIMTNGGMRVPRNAKEVMESRRGGYASGGAVAQGVHKHERHLHKGEEETKLKKGGRVKRKAGGNVHGKTPKARLDKRPRKAMGGPMGQMQPMQQPQQPQQMQAMPAPPKPQAMPAAPMMARPMPSGMATPGQKKGGAVKKRARGGSANNAYHEGIRTTEMPMELPQVDHDSEGPPKKARGGSTGKKHAGKTNIIIHAGGDPGMGQPQPPNPQALQQAHQAGMQQGMKQGAMMVMQKLKGAGAGGPPGAAPMGGPPPAPGGMPGGPPPGAPPMMPHKSGGRVHDPKPKLHQTPETVKVRAHVRRRGGAC